MDMSKFLKSLLLAVLIGWLPLAQAQELKCNVQVIANAVQLSNKQIFTTLQNAVVQFMNNRKWTELRYEQQEKIECSILIEITEAVSADEFSANIQIQSVRPVYLSAYKTSVFSHRDELVSFRYREFEQLEYQENQNMMDLTSVLAYYAYMVIGFDMDVFGNSGGTLMFQKARNIVNVCQGKSGWNPGDGRSNRNRHTLVENLLDARFTPLRNLMYQYHREGMDLMYDKPEKARITILEGLRSIQELARILPNSMYLKIFFNAKVSELVDIFKGAPPNEKNTAFDLLISIDPANRNRYEAIKAG
jgi:hypothetical protein